MKPLSAGKKGLFALLMLLGATVLAQDDATPAPAPEAPASEAVPEALPEIAPAVIDTAKADVPTLKRDDLLLWRLLGGGEIMGVLVKETPRQFYIDIGPTVIDVPRDSVVEKVDLAARQATEESPLGLGSATFDPATGAVVFSSGKGSSGLLTQREVLENVKKSVVLVSNPGGLGTGWFVSPDGKIVTNHHVVGRELYQTVTVFVKTGDQWERKKIENNKVLAVSDLLDIAVIQLDMDKARELGITFDPLIVAHSGSLEAGDNVYAVGNPGMGFMVLDHTISEGIASSLSRNFNDVIYLQTTAAVNPGNSGGPLVNMRGEVVGLITLKATFQEGVAFALPVDYIHHFIRHTDAFAVSEQFRNQGFRYHSPE